MRFSMCADASIFTQGNMIVYLAVHGQCAMLSSIEKRLRTVFDVNDREAFMRKYCALARVVSAPVRPAVPDHLDHFERASSR